MYHQYVKKLIITVLAVFYLGVSSGATVHFHYCMGELIEWGFTDDPNESADDCSNCGMEKGVSGDCCKEQKQEFKLKEAQKTAINTIQAKILTLAPISYPNYIETLRASQQVLIPVSLTPPLIQKTAVFLLNCNFRI